MIPIELQPEPEDFTDRVRSLGMRFLSQVSQPAAQQWKGREYWQRVLPDMRRSYGEICAYCAHWIPHGTGNHSIDHYIPKSQQPELAYEWKNYRYVSARFNSRKGTNRILDPFELEADWFFIDFSTYLIYPNPNLEQDQQLLIHQTIECLKLNSDDDLVAERHIWFKYYYENEITYEHLERHYPFLAYEILRQGIVR